MGHVFAIDMTGRGWAAIQSLGGREEGSLVLPNSVVLMEVFALSVHKIFLEGRQQAVKGCL